MNTLFDYRVCGGVLVAKTLGSFSAETRKIVLQQIANAYGETTTDAILIDHREAQITCSIEDTEVFGKLIISEFGHRAPCCIAVLADNQDLATMKLINESVGHATVADSQICISTHIEEELAFEEIASCRQRTNSMFKDVAWLD